MPNKQFIVAAASENTNNFGMRQFILVAQDGTTLKVEQQAYSFPPVKLAKGITVDLPTDQIGNFILDNTRFGENFSEQLPNIAPANVVKEVWKAVA
jgi:hypothetical protein